MRVMVCTWNMHGKEPSADLSPWLRPDSSSNGPPPDLYAIGTQEAERSIEASFLLPSKAAWLAKLTTALGDDYVCIGSQTLMAIHLALFVRRARLSDIGGVQMACVSTGAGGVMGNKGGVAVACYVGKTSFLFVNSHLAAHQHKVSERNADFRRIDTLLPLRAMPAADAAGSTVIVGETAAASAAPNPAGALAAASSVTDLPPACMPPPTVQQTSSSTAALGRASLAFDRIFWFGDLNYRINGPQPSLHP